MPKSKRQELQELFATALTWTGGNKKRAEKLFRAYLKGQVDRMIIKNKKGKRMQDFRHCEVCERRFLEDLIFKGYLNKEKSMNMCLHCLFGFFYSIWEIRKSTSIEGKLTDKIINEVKKYVGDYRRPGIEKKAKKYSDSDWKFIDLICPKCNGDLLIFKEVKLFSETRMTCADCDYGSLL